MILDTGCDVVSSSTAATGSVVVLPNGELIIVGSPNSIVFSPGKESGDAYHRPKVLVRKFEVGLVLPGEAYFSVIQDSLQWNAQHHVENPGAVIRDHTGSYLAVWTKNEIEEVKLIDLSNYQMKDMPSHGTAVAYLESAIWANKQAFDDKEEPLFRINAVNQGDRG